MKIIEKALHTLFGAPKIGVTRKFRSFAVAYNWILKNTDEAMQIKTAYSIEGQLDTELLVQLVSVFNEFSAVIDIAENHEIIQCVQKLVDKWSFLHIFRKILGQNTEIFKNYLNQTSPLGSLH